MVLFMGSVTKGYFVEEVCMSRKYPFAYLENRLDISEHTKEILAYDSVDYVVYDVEQYTNSASEIADNIMTVIHAKNAKPIILAAGFPHNSNILNVLRNVGINAFIYSISLTGKKEDFNNFLDDYYQYIEKISEDMEKYAETEEIVEFKSDERKEEPKYARTIAFAGSMHRIGTTTQALQVAKLYVIKGLRPCFIAFDSSFIKDIAMYYEECEVDEDWGRVTFGEIDMYYDLDKLPEILAMCYDCFIYDFGVFGSNTFNRVSFLEKERTFIVCGGKSSEILYTNKILENSFYKNVNYIFSFVPKADQQDILELMEELKGQTYFTDYVPDPFSYSPTSDFYNDIIGVQEEKKSKRGIRGWFRRK